MFVYEKLPSLDFVALMDCLLLMSCLRNIRRLLMNDLFRYIRLTMNSVVIISKFIGPGQLL